MENEVDDTENKNSGVDEKFIDSEKENINDLNNEFKVAKENGKI